MNICFDIDGCLISEGKVIEANVALLEVLAKSHKVYLWSGNGWKYALGWADKLNVKVCGVLDKYNTF